VIVRVLGGDEDCGDEGEVVVLQAPGLRRGCVKEEWDVRR